MEYLFVDGDGNPLIRDLPINAHTLGKIFDGDLKAYKFESGLWWQMVAKAENNRFTENWIPLLPPLQKSSEPRPNKIYQILERNPN